MTFRLRLATPDKTFFDEDAEAMVCPGLGGYFGVLSRHQPLIGGIGSGILRIKVAGDTRFFVVDGGLAEVRGTAVEILANAVFPAETAADAEERMEELKSAKQHRPIFT